MKRKYSILFCGILAVCMGIALTGCQYGDLASNENVATASSTVPVSLIFDNMAYQLYDGGGVLDAEGGAVAESPWGQMMRWNQFFVSNYSYYWGSNFYTWSNSATAYNVLNYVYLMQGQITKQYGSTPTIYTGLAEFFKAYSFIWLTQRVGDIPLYAAAQNGVSEPAYTSQDSVYYYALQMLDSANTEVTPLATASPAATVNGDIYGLTYLQWQKVINTYKLRVLISLSRRAVDNAWLNIPQQFANIINNPSKYPIMAGNTDNLAFQYNANTSKDLYPIFLSGDDPYNNFSNIGDVYLNITTANQDPRTFVVATPTPNAMTAGDSVGDFGAYKGSTVNLGQSDLLDSSESGDYSFANFNRYYATTDGSSCEPYIIIGYPEMCFNIAEAINRGWVSGTTATWYDEGINASLAMYGLTNGEKLTVGGLHGATLGTATVNIPQFLNNPNVTYAGDNATGLTQILQQKYVAFFQNSGWEAYYNWRRTGIPAFDQGGPGIGTSTSQIPIRWMYPQNEITYNAANYNAAIASQFQGNDNVFATMWLTK